MEKRIFIGVVKATAGTTLFVLVMLSLGKVFIAGTHYTQGKVISFERKVFTDCIEISKTTEGESAISKGCVYYDLPEVKIGDVIKIRYHRSPIVFMDTMDFEVIKEDND